MKKTIVLIIIIIIVVCGIWLLWNKRKTPPIEPENNEDKISELLKEIKEATGIDFSEIQAAEFRWYKEKEEKMQELTIGGKGIEAKEIANAKYKQIEPLLESKGFEVDMYNVADGTVVGAVGYEKDQLACVVVAGISGYKEATGQWIPPETDIMDLEIKCGQLE